MRTHIKWTGEARYLGKNMDGHEVMMDGPPEHGGKCSGFRPMEMLLLGLGGCAGFYMVHILQKMHLEVEDCEVEVTAERDKLPPALFQSIHLHYRIKCGEISKAQMERAIDLLETKYCTVSILLSSTTTISHDYEIIKSDALASI